MKCQIEKGDRIKLVKLTPETTKKHPSLIIGMEGTFVRDISAYGTNDEEKVFYCIDLGQSNNKWV